MNESVVSIARCTTYELDEVRSAVRQSLSALPDLDRALPKGSRVLLKPNLLSSSAPPELAVNTHPTVIQAVGEFCVERGCSVAIGDSCGSLSPGSTEEALRITRIPEICEKLGAVPLNFDRSGSFELDRPQAKYCKHIALAKAVRECDVIFNLPKLKTHGLTLLTAGVKNMLGVVPGKGKKEMHVAAPKPAALAEALVELYETVRPRVNLLDAVVGMEGNGPSAGRPRHVGLLLASTDAVALDAVAGAVIGYDPAQIATTRFAGERGLGAAELGGIEVVGPSLESVAVANFRKPAGIVRSALLAAVPSRLARFMFDYFGSVRSTVRRDRCKLCGECVTNCPARALQVKDGRIICDEARCIGCYCCDEVCKHMAIEMKRPLPAKLFHSAVNLWRRWRSASFSLEDRHSSET